MSNSTRNKAAPCIGRYRVPWDYASRFTWMSRARKPTRKRPTLHGQGENDSGRSCIPHIHLQPSPFQLPRLGSRSLSTQPNPV